MNLHCTAHRISSHSFLHQLYAKLLSYNVVFENISSWPKDSNWKRVYHTETLSVADIPTG